MLFSTPYIMIFNHDLLNVKAHILPHIMLIVGNLQTVLFSSTNFLYSVYLPQRILLDFPSVTPLVSFPFLRLWHQPPPPRGNWPIRCKQLLLTSDILNGFLSMLLSTPYLMVLNHYLLNVKIHEATDLSGVGSYASARQVGSPGVASHFTVHLPRHLGEGWLGW